MSRTTIAGLIFGVILFLSAIVLATDNYRMFFSPASVLLVVGGTLANAFISYQGRYVVAALRDIFRIFGHARMNEGMIYDEARNVVRWGQIVQKNGALALDRHIKGRGSSDHFISYGIQLVVDGYKPPVVRELLTNSMQSAYDRAMRQVDVLRNMASTAPAFGMIGTLVGLIIMLDSLGGTGEDAASALGQGLAVALLTTLYGVLMARFVFQPAADKTAQREDIARFRAFLMMEGFVMLAEGRNARYIRERIHSFLDPAVVAAFRDQKGGGPAADGQQAQAGAA